jgi:hypothetical protein
MAASVCRSGRFYMIFVITWLVGAAELTLVIAGAVEVFALSWVNMHSPSHHFSIAKSISIWASTDCSVAHRHKSNNVEDRASLSRNARNGRQGYRVRAASGSFSAHTARDRLIERQRMEVMRLYKLFKRLHQSVALIL